MELSLQELKDTALIRAGLYSLFSRIFREETDEQLLKSMKSRLEEADLSTILNDPSEDSAFKEGFNNLINFLTKNSITNELQQELASDYASLFLGAGKKPAHPYESVYVSQERIIMRGAWKDVCRIYNEHCLIKEKSFSQPEDHIAVELEFMSYLCLEMKNKIEEGDTESTDRLVP